MSTTNSIHHSPLPWKVTIEKYTTSKYAPMLWIDDANGDEVSGIVHGLYELEEEALANAAYIVQAVNAYPRLLAGLQDAFGILEDAYGHADAPYQPAALHALSKLRHALSVLGGEEGRG